MSGRTDEQLLDSYVRSRDEDAFAEVVGRYVHTIYSAARRQVRDAHLAQDVTQSVFILLAQKAQVIRKRSSLAGWLFKSTWFVVRDALKSKACRFRHEQQVAAMNEHSHQIPDPDARQAWREIEPALDDAMARLSEIDRSALVLRYLQDKPLEQVAEILNSSPAAAAKRVSRALAKLRKILARRTIGGAAIPSGLLGASLATSAGEAAPPALAATIAQASLRHAATAGVSHAGFTLKGALLSTTKAKVAAIAIAALFTIGVPTTIYTLAREQAAPPAPVAPAAPLAVLPPTTAPASTNPSEAGDVHRLANGQVLKRVVGVPAAVREKWLRALLPGANDIHGPMSVFVGWDRDNIVVKWIMGGPDFSLVDFIETTRHVSPEEIEGSFRDRRTSGDIIFDRDATDDQYCAALVKYMHDEMAINATAAFRDVPGKVIVFRGQWKYTPFPKAPATGKLAEPCIDIFGVYTLSPHSQSVGGGVADNGDDVARILSNWVHQKVVIEADGVPQRIGIRFFGNPTRDSADHKLALQHFAEETGLTYTQESRQVHHLFIEAKKPVQ